MNAAKRRRTYTAEQKCRVVLAMWTRKKKGTELCREVGITWQMLNRWQGMAMEGLVRGLRPREGERKSGPALGRQVRQLLDRKVLMEESSRRTLVCKSGTRPQRSEIEGAEPTR